MNLLPDGPNASNRNERWVWTALPNNLRDQAADQRMAIERAWIGHKQKFVALNATSERSSSGGSSSRSNVSQKALNVELDFTRTFEELPGCIENPIGG